MNKTQTSYEIIVSYFELFEDVDFNTALWRATKGMPFLHRMMAMGGAQTWQKRRGKLVEGFYIMTLTVPRGIRKNVRFGIRPFGA